MKKKLQIIAIIVVVIVFLLISIPQFIFTVGLPPDDKPFNSEEFHELMGGAYEETSLDKQNESSIKLSTVFADHEIAMTEIKKLLKAFIFELSVKYSLPEFNENTIDEYQEALFQYREDNYRASKGAPMYKLGALSYFCQTYKNAKSNAKILLEKGIKNDIDNAMAHLFKVSSKGYINQVSSFLGAKLIVADMLEYMKTTYDLELLTDETIPVYRELLDKVPDDPYAFDKEFLEKFFEIYTAQ